MKSICKLLIYTFTTIILATGCSKKEPALPAPAVIKLTLKGYSQGDTLEAVNNNAVIATMRADMSFETISLIAISGEKEQVTLRKKSTKEILSTFEVTRQPFVQTKKIFFDGKKVDDKIELTPVSNPNNMGFRMMFKTNYAHFYGGPVDIVLYEQTVNQVTYEFSFKEIKICKDIGDSFSSFIELPPLISTDEIVRSYVYKVFKAGTKELPYTAAADLTYMSGPEYNYGNIEDFKAGDSRLLIIGPYYTDNYLGDGYQVDNIALYFK